MKKGDVINGYTILQDFSTAGGGMSQWSFAAKGSKQYFIKAFLAPTYPVDGSPGSPKLKRDKRRRCQQFEQRQRALMEKLSPKGGAGGNLVITLDFFRSGAKYYKITDKVDTAGLTLPQLAALPPTRKILVLRTIAHSLAMLHGEGIVHGDLKPDNMLVKQTSGGQYVAKLIDFDDSYLAGEPPANPDEVVGDPVYYSPELLRYVQRDAAMPGAQLGVPSDIFALGLLYTQLLTGALPPFHREQYPYAATAVLHGERLAVPAVPEPTVASLLERMLAREPASRPDIQRVFAVLKQWQPSDLKGTFKRRPGLEAATAGTPGGASASSAGLQGTLMQALHNKHKL